MLSETKPGKGKQQIENQDDSFHIPVFLGDQSGKIRVKLFNCFLLTKKTYPYCYQPKELYITRLGDIYAPEGHTP
jgi:hypothetical protein